MDHIASLQCHIMAHHSFSCLQGKLEHQEATKKEMEAVLRTHWDTRAGLEEDTDRLQIEVKRLEADLAAQTARNGAFHDISAFGHPSHVDACA